ncbi:MAG TPA: SMC-Scp complex subunit ScpB [Candidatus Paceibacterota bacterium]
MRTPPEVLIEAALFFKGGACSIAEIASATGLSKEEAAASAASLARSLEGRGIRLVRERDMLALATSADTNEMIETMRREELEGPLGKAGLETLAIIVFRGPLSRANIEYVRGVNCSSILRSLLIRGLIERVEHPSDKRSFLYRATAELPAHLGVGQLADIPEYAEMRQGIEKIFKSREEAHAEVRETPEHEL